MPPVLRQPGIALPALGGAELVDTRWCRDEVRVEQGQTRELELAVTLGARIGGRLVDVRESSKEPS